MKALWNFMNVTNEKWRIRINYRMGRITTDKYVLFPEDIDDYFSEEPNRLVIKNLKKDSPKP